MDANALPDWQGFFTFVGVVAGGLTGLIFVALSIHVTEVTARPAYIARARTTLGALTGFVVLCGLALLPGQTATAFGVECLVLFVILTGDVVRHFHDFEAPGRDLERPLLVRTTIAILLFALGAVGSLGLLVDIPWAMFVVGLSTLLGLPVRVIQAWALLVAALPIERASDAPLAAGGAPGGRVAGATVADPDRAGQ
jgi:hypothetical protein